MQKLLKLHPHKHTGKLLHHRHTSYRALFLILALTGAVMLAPIGMARADDYVVSAIVPAPLPDGPAVITSPTDSGTTTQATTVIHGNCPVIDPPIIVVLYEGTNVIGSQQCAGDGTFAIPVSLNPGSHTIITQVMNFTGQNGAAGTPVVITYTPTAAQNAPTATGSNAQSSSPADDQDAGSHIGTGASVYPTITTDNPFLIFGPDKDAIWTGDIQGGTAPYTVTINWGDGTIQKIHNVSEGLFRAHHHYTVMKTYSVRMEVRDVKGRVLGVTITAISPAQFSAYPAPSIIGSTNLSRTWLLYGLYILTVVALTMFWHRERLHYAQQRVPITVTKRRAPAKRKRK
jgi:hypothetical protein